MKINVKKLILYKNMKISGSASVNQYTIPPIDSNTITYVAPKTFINRRNIIFMSSLFNDMIMYISMVIFRVNLITGEIELCGISLKSS